MSIPPRKKIGQNILKFSIRKLSIGVTSAVIGSFILGATPLAHETVAFAETNQTQRSVTYHYVADSELSAQEKQLLQAGLPQDNLQSEQMYYIVYRSEQALPATGDSNLDALIASLGGIALMVVAVKVLKGNKKVMALVLISSLGQSLIVDSASAVQPALFAHLSQTFTLNTGDAMPTPIAIEGYQYAGYVVGTLEIAQPEPSAPTTNLTSDSVKAEPTSETSNSSAAQPDRSSNNVEGSKVTPTLEPITPPSTGNTDEATPAPSTSGETPPSSTEDTAPEPPSSGEATGEVTPAPPTNGETPPSSGEATDEATPEPPTKGETPPSAGNTDEATPAPPTSGETLPSSGEATDEATPEPPTKGETPPSSGEATGEVMPEPPTSGETPPSSGEATGEATPAPPTSGEATGEVMPEPPASGETPPSSGEATGEATPESPTSGETLPSSGEATGEATPEPPTSGETPPSSGEATGEATPEKQPNKEALLATINESDTKVSTDYSEASWRIFEEALEASRALQVTPQATQDQINQSLAQLRQALANLSIDKTALNTSISTAQAKASNDYSPSSWEALTNALAEANAVNSATDAKQSAIESARIKLNEALANLTVDKAALNTSISTAQAKASNDYSPSSWEALTNALAEANAVNSATDTKQSAIESARTKLNEALANLTVDKTALNTSISTAQAKAASDYSPETWHVLSTVLQEVTGVYSDDSAKQSQVNAAMLALSDALKQLNVNKSPLEAKIAEQQQLDPTHYTTASWQRLTDAIANANRVKDTASVKQSELNAEEAKVTAALAGLQSLRTQPTIAVVDTTTSAFPKNVTLTHEITDPDAAYVNGQVNIYKEGVLVSSVPIIKGTPTVIADLDYNTPYELETVMTYDIGNGQQETKLSEKQAVELTLKKIAIKDAKAVSLFALEGHEYHKVLSLPAVPTDLSTYYVAVESDHHKAWRLPVKAITEETVNEQAVYRITVAYPELVEDQGASYEMDYSFFVAKHTPQDGVYTSFTSLLEAMKLNPTGQFTLGADLSAAGVALASTAVSYLTEDFRGQLNGESNGKQFAIFDLAAPLFNNVVDATIRHLDLKQVNIETLDQTVGALAKKATKSTIEDVTVEGTIVAERNIGGLVGKSDQSQLNNVAFAGNIQALSDQDVDSYVGGLVGEIHEGRLTKGYVAAELRVRATSPRHKVGMIAGRLYGSKSWAHINQAYAKGSLENSGSGGQVGGLLGSAYANGRLQNAVTEVLVTNGNTVYGDTGHKDARVHTESVFAVEQETNAVKDQWTTYITPAEAKAKLEAMRITTTSSDTGELVEQSGTVTDYMQVADAQAGRETAYYNTMKLSPFYNKEYIVRMGNTIATDDKLYREYLLSVTPFKAGKLASGDAINARDIDQVWLHFADGTLEKRAVTYKESFGETGIAEYTIEGVDVLYTPETFQVASQQLVTDALAVLAPLAYEGQEVWTALDGKGDQAQQLEALYLKDSFNAVKADLSTVLNTVLNTSAVYATDKGVLAYIEQNKAQLLLGLAYVNRWYNIDFADTNIKDLALYRQDFFGRQVDTLRWLVNVGSQGFQRLNPINNHELNPLIMGLNQYTTSIRESLDAYRNVFATDLSESEWFKASTKAYIAEGHSLVDNQPVGVSDVYEKLTDVHRRGNKTFDYRNMLLPLLTLSDEGVYIIPTMSTITFGAFDKYIDSSLKTSQPELYAQKVAELKATINREAVKQGEHFAAWYRIALPSVREQLLQGLPVWDSLYNHNNTKWAPHYGDDTALAVREFFGPTGNWRDKKLNAEAYSNGTTVVFELVGVLDQNGGKGSSIFTHEQVHNFDNTVYLGGYKRRPGHSAESFAEGLLQAPRGDGNRIRYSFGINLIHDGEAPTNYPEYNATPQRFQNAEDLQAYMHGVMDVVYMLDYAEAEAIRHLPKEKQRQLLTKLESKAGTTAEDAVNHNDHFRNFTDEEWNALNLTGINDFVDNAIALKRFYKDGKRGLRNNEWDAYVKVPLFSPFYSLEENQTGTSGGYTFRRTAFELLAHKGYEQGFVPYVSNQYVADAQNDGVALSDSYIISKVLAGEHANLKDFKKAMFQERIAKLSQLKAVEAFELQVGSEMKQYNLSSFEAIQQAITELTQYDVTHQTTHVLKLKEIIFKQYMKQTNEFRESIFNP